MRLLKPIGTTIVALCVFIVAFLAFIVAPLILVVAVCGSMWGWERIQVRRRLPGVRSISVPRSLQQQRQAGSRRETTDADAEAFGFGSGLRKDY